jgi:hypothetical protein
MSDSVVPDARYERRVVEKDWVSREWRFYETEFVKTHCENSLCFIFCSFLPTSDNNSPLSLDSRI